MKEKFEAVIGAIVVILFVVFLYGISWLITCGIIKLITMCFGLLFTWKFATGIWLVICLLKSAFNFTIKVKE